VLHTIVEGEPGIFPEPVARIMRTIGGWFGRKEPTAEPPTPPAGTDTATNTATDTDTPTDSDDHTGESR
jgi:hypothetical protein